MGTSQHRRTVCFAIAPLLTCLLSGCAGGGARGTGDARGANDLGVLVAEIADSQGISLGAVRNTLAEEAGVDGSQLDLARAWGRQLLLRQLRQLPDIRERLGGAASAAWAQLKSPVCESLAQAAATGHVPGGAEFATTYLTDAVEKALGAETVGKVLSLFDDLSSELNPPPGPALTAIPAPPAAPGTPAGTGVRSEMLSFQYC